MPVGAHWVGKSDFPNIPDAWRSEVVALLARQGLGSSTNTGDDQEFQINGDGIIQAEKIAFECTKFGKIKKFGTDNWLSLGALIVAIFALFK